MYSTNMRVCADGFGLKKKKAIANALARSAIACGSEHLRDVHRDVLVADAAVHLPRPDGHPGHELVRGRAPALVPVLALVIVLAGAQRVTSWIWECDTDQRWWLIMSVDRHIRAPSVLYSRIARMIAYHTKWTRTGLLAQTPEQSPHSRKAVLCSDLDIRSWTPAVAL